MQPDFPGDYYAYASLDFSAMKAGSREGQIHLSVLGWMLACSRLIGNNLGARVIRHCNSERLEVLFRFESSEIRVNFAELAYTCNLVIDFQKPRRNLAPFNNWGEIEDVCGQRLMKQISAHAARASREIHDKMTESNASKEAEDTHTQSV